MCRRPGIRRCTQCKGADPESYYCSPECQNHDWPSHKKFCGKQSYVFDVELLDISDPKITRKVAVPSWWTFKQFHLVLQYIFLPWQNYHLHTFQFLKDHPVRFNSVDGQEILLELGREGDGGSFDSYNWFDERKVKLSDVFGVDGRLRSQILYNGDISPLLYRYDFGDNWEHKITFVKSELARAARPIVKDAVGCGPVEDCGSSYGWERVKKAFAAAEPTPEQDELIQWAKDVACRQNFNALEEPSLTQLNDENRWGTYEMAYKADERMGNRFMA